MLPKLVSSDVSGALLTSCAHSSKSTNVNSLDPDFIIRLALLN